MLDIKGKIIFITGASSGIGAACADIFAANGAKLVLCARRKERIEQLAQKLQDKYGTDIYSLVLDIQDRNMVQEQLEQLPQAWQDIAVLVNNAGLSLGLDGIAKGNIDDWEQMINTNIKGLLYVTRQILPGMLKRNSGHIINIGSVAGHEVYAAGSVYCATKHAVRALNKGLLMEVCGTDVRVTSVDPGMVETEFSEVRFKGDTQQAKDFYQDMTPLTGADIADAVYYCATRPLHVNISDMVIWPKDQAAIHVLHRRTKV